MYLFVYSYVSIYQLVSNIQDMCNEIQAFTTFVKPASQARVFLKLLHVPHVDDIYETIFISRNKKKSARKPLDFLFITNLYYNIVIKV